MAYLKHVVESALKIESYVMVGRETFMRDSHWQDAVIRQLEIIGEASKHLSDALRERHPEIPWRRMTGMRDVLSHDYMGVDIETVWEVTQKHIPDLRKRIEGILDEIT